MTPRFHILRATPLGLALLLAGALAAPALASDAAPRRSTAKATVKTAKVKQKIAKPRFDKGSGETVSERERRLYRECQGRPNAGACEGYAR